MLASEFTESDSLTCLYPATPHVGGLRVYTRSKVHGTRAAKGEVQMKTLYHAFALSTAFWAGSTVFAGSVGAPQTGQTVAIGNLNAAILSGTINGFYYAGGNSSSSNFVGGGAPGPFLSSSVPAGPNLPAVPSLLLASSGSSSLNAGTGSGGATNASGSNSSSSSNSGSNSSNSNTVNSNTSNSNSSSNSSGSNSSSGGSSGTNGTSSLLSAQLFQSPENAVTVSVPDNGSAIALLGAALAGVALLRRKRRV